MRAARSKQVGISGRLPTDEVASYFHSVIGPDDLDPDFDADVRANGVHTPIEISTDGTRAAITDGHHRTLSAQGGGLPDVPVQVYRVPSMYDSSRGGEAGEQLLGLLQDYPEPVFRTAASDFKEDDRDFQQWLAVQPQRSRDWYRTNPERAHEDYELSQQPGVAHLDDGRSSPGHGRKPVYRPDRVNPVPDRTQESDGRPLRPRTPRDYVDDPADMLDLEFEDGQMPRELSPVEMWRGQTIDLSHPDAAELRAIVFGSDDQQSRNRKPRPGQMQLYAPEKPLSYNEFFEENPQYSPYAEDDDHLAESLAAWQKYYRDTRGHQEPLHDIPPDFESLELGPKVLDYLSSDPDSGSNLGRHWSPDSLVADQFAGVRPGYDHHLNDPDQLRVRMRADWSGLGEDTGRTNTGGDHYDENEITLVPDAPVTIRDLQVWHPDQRWVSVLPEPQQRTATSDFEEDDELDLYWKWTMEDQPEWLEDMSPDAQVWFADWAKGVDDDQWAEWQSGDDPTYQAAQNDFVEFLQGNIGVNPWTDTEDEEEDEFHSDSEGYDSRAYYLPGADKNDRDFKSRPELPDGHKRYYSPREVNPESDAWSRPETEFEESEPEQEMLPLGGNNPADPHGGLGGWDHYREYFDAPTDPQFTRWLADEWGLDTESADLSRGKFQSPINPHVQVDFEGIKTDYQMRGPGKKVMRDWPSDREPIDLWRGEPLDLRSPELADVRRMLYGDEFEDGFNLHHSEPVIEGIDDPQAPGDPNLLSDKALTGPHPEGWNNPELGPRLLDYITENMHKTRVPLSDGSQRRLPLTGDGGLGRHWSRSRDIADQYSGMERVDPLTLPVRMRSQWKGQGEDPYRSNTGGHYDHEQEVTILPGAPMDIADLEIYNRRERAWRPVLPEPQQRYAATRRLSWLYETLQESWVDDNFETLPWAEEYGDKAWGTFNDWLHDLDDGQFEEWEGLAGEEGDLSYLSELIQDDFEDYLSNKGIPFTDDDEEEPFDPSTDSDPDFENAGRLPGPDEVDSSHRPQRADDLGKRYFSPRDNNPASDSPARPDLQFSPREFEEPFLPLGEDDDYQWPVEQYADLWRGESLDLGSPELADVRRGLYGDDYEHMYGFTDGMIDFEDFDLTAQPWGKGQGPDGTDLDPLQTPQFADRLLDHITENMHRPLVPLSDGERRRLPLTGDGGMGRHWTSDEGVSHGYAPGRGMMLPVVVRGEWAGQGEDPYRTNTGGNYPDEFEVTLNPGAPVDITDVQVRDPHEQGVSWQSLPVERQQRLAAHPLREQWLKAHESGGMDAPLPDWIASMATSARDAFPEWVQSLADEELDRIGISGAPKDQHAFKQYLRDNDIPVDQEDEDVDFIDYPDAFDPDFESRPEKADGNRYYSPRAVNPEPEGTARPDIDWQFEDPEHPVLPGMEGLKDRQPVWLYRGTTFDAGSIPDYGVNPEDPAHIPAILDQLQQRHRKGPGDDGGMGRHWSADPWAARQFAETARRDRGGTPVVVRTQWRGQGEDPYRTNTGGDFHDEREVTQLPGSPLLIDQLRTYRGPSQPWHTLAPEQPLDRFAATLTDFEEAAGTEHTYYPLDRANPDYDYAPSQVRIINPEAQYYGYDGELIDVGENMLYVSIDDGADIVAYDPSDVRRVTSRRVVAYDPLGEQDWAEIYADLPDVVHRGIGVNLPDDLHRTVYDESLSPDERARALLQHLITPDARRGPWGNDWREGLGTSWSGNEGVAEDFSRTNADQFTSHNEGEALSAEDFAWGTDEFGDPVGKPGTAVMLHAERPSLEDIDDDPNGDGSGMRYTYHGHGEQEVPVRGGASLGIRGISWRPVLPMGHPDYVTDPEEYIRHTFGEPLYYQAARQAKTGDAVPFEPGDFKDDELLDLLTGDTFGRPAPVADPQFEEPEPVDGIPAGWERYYNHISDTPDSTGNAHTMLPTEVVRHYREYERDPDSESAQVLRRVIEEHGGIRQPLVISTDGTDALLTEGNHRAEIAHQLGIGELPVKIYYDDAVQTNEGTPVPMEDTLRDYVETHRDTLPSFWGRRTAEWDEAAALARIEEDLAKFREQASQLKYVTPQPGTTLAVGPDWSGSVPSGHPDRIPRQAEADDIHGYLSHSDDGHVDFIYASPMLRRNGIGTSLLDHAGITDTAYAHRFTPDGRKFFDALGGSRQQRQAARRTAMPTYYHITDNADFELDPEFVPENLDGYGSEAGVFVTRDPDLWRHGYPGREDRQFVVEFDGPDRLHRVPGVKTPNWSYLNDGAYGIQPEEYFVPPGQFGQLRNPRVRRVKTAMPTYYHLTDNADFELDPGFRPTNNDFSGGSWSPGVFLTNDPEQWGEFYGDERPYIAEIDAPDGLAALDGVMDLRSVGETYVPAKHFDQLALKGVRPR